MKAYRVLVLALFVVCGACGPIRDEVSPRESRRRARDLEIHWIAVAVDRPDEDPRDVMDDTRERAGDPRVPTGATRSWTRWAAPGRRARARARRRRAL